MNTEREVLAAEVASLKKQLDEKQKRLDVLETADLLGCVLKDGSDFIYPYARDERDYIKALTISLTAPVPSETCELRGLEISAWTKNWLEARSRASDKEVEELAKVIADHPVVQLLSILKSRGEVVRQRRKGLSSWS